MLIDAKGEKIERAKTIRIDSTSTQTDIHPPTDSSLLWDGMRVMVRLLEQLSDLPGARQIRWRNHRRVAKKRASAIVYTRGQKKKTRLYQDLLNVTQNTQGYLAQTRVAARLVSGETPQTQQWCAEAAHYQNLITRVIDQTRRRVVHGESVQAA